MNALVDNHCEACRVGAPAVKEEEMPNLLRQIPLWTLESENGIPQLRRQFDFPNFRRALDFANQVGALAEAEGHHPALLVEWGAVTVAWWTHKIKALHKNDFIMAAKTDHLFKENSD